MQDKGSPESGPGTDQMYRTITARRGLGTHSISKHHKQKETRTTHRQGWRVEVQTEG